MREEIIMAASGGDAVEKAKGIHVDMLGLDANSIYLSDASGRVIWSLRLGDVWLGRDC
ncbi:hypothetical protein ACRBEV_33270 (plasmid) [Methylobacterium phyllosphaerae]